MRTVELKIEDVAFGGKGVARDEGKAVFVPFTIEGERVTAKITREKKQFAEGELVELIELSPDRVTPECPYFGRCGGCSYQHISYPHQLELKARQVEQAMRRIGRIAEPPMRPMVPSPLPYGYRNRAQWAVRDAKPRALGYFLPESSVITPIDQCPVLSPLLAKTFGELQESARSGALPEKIAEIEAFADSSDAKLALNVAFERFPKSPQELAASFRAAMPQLESLLLLDQSKDRFELTGPGYLVHEAGGFRYRVSHLSFFQVNRFVIEDLLRTMTAGAKGELALDLYAGVGFFGLPLARTFKKVISVDANLAATHDLHANAEAAGVTLVSHNEHVEEFLGKFTERPDFVSLDPPRSGLGAEAAAKLAALGAPEIAYLSCDPSTLARDLAVLTGSAKKGQVDTPKTRYEIVEMHLFDLFPQTYHIETLVRLRRAP